MIFRIGAPKKKIKKTAGNPPLYLGRRENRDMRFSGEGSLLTVGPPGTGKSRGVAVWNLLRYPGSMLVTDPKGELVGWSAYRRKKMGASVAVCDPFGITGHPSTPVNPLADLLTAAGSGRGLREEVRRIAFLLMPEGKDKQDRYWRNGARNLIITGLFYLVGMGPQRCHLAALHDLLWKDNEAFIDDVLLPLKQYGGGPAGQYAGDVLDTMIETGKQFATFRQDAREALGIFAPDEACGRDTMHAGLDLADLMAGNLTVYLVLPPEHVASHGRWMGLVVASAIQAAMRYQGRGDCVYLLDEFPNLGNLGSSIKDAIALLRGKGLRVWMFVQDIAQLEDVYGKIEAEAMRSQAEVLQVLGCRSAGLAEFIEKRAGLTTAKTLSVGMPDPFEDDKGPRLNIGETGVPVLPAAAVMEMPHGKQILIRHGYPVRIADVVLWDGQA